MNASNDMLYPLPWQADISKRFALIRQAPGAVLLDSGQPGPEGPGRYDLASAWPLKTIQPKQDESATNFMGRARRLLNLLPEVSQPLTELPFCGGLIGYLAYGFNQRHSQHEKLLPNASIGLYCWALINDHQTQQSWLFCHPQMKVEQCHQLLKLFKTTDAQQTPTENFSLADSFQPNITGEHYLEAIEQIQHNIANGLCQQINYTQRFTSAYRGDPWQAWCSLKQRCPVPYAAYMRLAEDSSILSFSPESFLNIRKRLAEARPIKGTRRRGHDQAEDLALAAELLASAKDRAENRMIVELQKDEFAPLCTGIQVPQLAMLESYPNVHHLVSSVQGQLKPGKDALDLLLHCFPPASISGTPKPAALAMIDELEANAREIYCGSIFHLDRNGQLGSSVCIRTLLAHQGQLHCWGGGAITAASDPADEYQESVDKVSLLMRTLEQQYGPETIRQNSSPDYKLAVP